MKNRGINITSNFNFDDKVRILPLEVDGRVTSFWAKEENYIMVEVRYFINNEKKIEYFYEDELEIIKEQKNGVLKNGNKLLLF